MATRTAFVDDSGETRLSGFLVPEPANGTFPVDLVGDDPTVDDLLLIEEPPDYAGESNTGNVFRVNDGATDLLLVDAYGDVTVRAPVGQGAAQLQLHSANGDVASLNSTSGLSLFTGGSLTLGSVFRAHDDPQTLGFFGVAEVAQPVVPATPLPQDIVDALVALGLVSQSA